MNFPGRKMVTIAVLLMFLTRLATPALAAKSAVKLNKWAGAIDFQETGPSPFTLAGTASHLGKFTAEGEITLTPGEEEGSFVGTGVVVFTAANGDKLNTTWTGFGFPTSDPNVLGIVEHGTITGGTGRFANASGSFTVERLFNFVTSSGPGSFEGTIHLR